MGFQPVNNLKLSEKVVEQILDSIRKGELKPGDKLPNEMVLAQQMGVSRGILRESLALLKSLGYITRKPKDGTYISEQISIDMITEGVQSSMQQASYRDLVEMREAFEYKVVQMVVQKATDQEIDELADVLLGRVDPRDDFQADYYFHYRLAELSGNIIFMNFIVLYYDLINEFATKSFQDHTRREKAVQEHMDIVRALRQRDSEAAVTAMKQHLRMVSSRVTTLS